MENLYIVLLKFFPVLALILLGVLIRRIHLLKADTIQELKTILINISLPSMFVLTFARTAFELRYILIFATIFLLDILTFFLGKGISKKLAPKNSYFPAVFCGHETGMLGYALFTAFFGSENTFKLAIFDIAQVTFVFFVLVNFLRKQNGDNASVRQVVQGFLKSPIILSIFAGILISSTGLTGVLKGYQFTGAAVGVLEQLGSLTVPLICITIGYELNINFKGIIRPLITVLLRMGIMLIAAIAINAFLVKGILKLDSSFSVALFTMFLLPPPFVIPIFMGQEAIEEKNDILNVISVHIVMTLAAFFVLVNVMT